MCLQEGDRFGTAPRTATVSLILAARRRDLVRYYRRALLKPLTHIFARIGRFEHQLL